MHMHFVTRYILSPCLTAIFASETGLASIRMIKFSNSGFYWNWGWWRWQ